MSALSGAFLIFMLGVFAGRNDWLPSRLVGLALHSYEELSKRPWYYFPLSKSRKAQTDDRGRAQPGLNLLTRVAGDRQLLAEVIDKQGKVLQRWDMDWFEVWPNANHLPKSHLPKDRPGGHLHGAILLPGGDLVCNYDHLGLVRLDKNSKVVWRLPYRTHHSIHMDDDGVLWVPGQRERTEPHPKIQGLSLPRDDYTILQVSQAGKVLKEHLLSELLVANGYDGLYGFPAHEHSLIRDDRLHLNDVEPFSAKLEPGFFVPGDVAVSLRNVNTVFVFNKHTNEIKAIWTGQFVRQHDPDFIDGNRISVFDNNVRGSVREDAPDRIEHPRSRILILDAPSGKVEVLHPKLEFFTEIMGKHQWLANGNLLITESMRGRAFELDPQGNIVWEYLNQLDDDLGGVVEEVQRLAPEFDSVFSANKN